MSQFRPSMAPLFTVIGLVLAGGLFALANCSRADLYGNATFTDNVEAAYEECDESEITFLAGKHGIQTAFDNCGSNKFAQISWSTDGRYLYFQLTHGGYILDGETKAITTVPTATPTAGAAWLRQDMLAIPVGPSAEQPKGKERIAFYNRAANTLQLVAIDVKEPQDLWAMGEGDRVVFTALDAQGVRRPFELDPNTEELKPALPWLTEPVAHLVYEHGSGLMSWSTGTDSELMSTADGASLLLLPGVKRAIPHPDGRYVALETMGEPISPFDQRTWNELSPEARERELARRDQWLKRLPDWAPRDMQPPELQILDMSTSERYRITSFFGDHFEWYKPRPYFCSFILWGIEGKQLHRNVALTDIAERLRMASKGDIPMGMERVGEGPAQPEQPEQPVQPVQGEGGAAG